MPSTPRRSPQKTAPAAKRSKPPGKQPERDVLKILEQNARTSHESIATMTGLPLAEVQRIVTAAEGSRSILRYKTAVNWERVGEQRVTAVIEVKVAPERNVGFDAVAERIYRFPEAKSVYLMSGTYDLLVLVTGADMYEVSRFVSNKLATIEAVTGTVTHFVMKRYKEDGEVLVEPEQVRRQPLSL